MNKNLKNYCQKNEGTSYKLQNKTIKEGVARKKKEIKSKHWIGTENKIVKDKKYKRTN